MKDKAPLTLMELCLMLLVFALAAGLCLQAFAHADTLSRKAEARDDALLLAQSAAETLKHCRGDFEKAAALLEGSWDGTSLHREKNGLRLTAVPEATDLPTLGRAAIRVLSPTHGELAGLTVSWQEVTGHE